MTQWTGRIGALGLLIAVGISGTGCERCAYTSSMVPIFFVELSDPSGEPIVGATLALDPGACTESDTPGGYICDPGDEPGDVAKLTVQAEGYAEHTESVSLVEGSDHLCPYADDLSLAIELQAE